MIVPLLLLSLSEPALSFEKLAPGQRPTLEAVKKVLAVCAEGNTIFTLHTYSASYLTRWLPRVVVDIESRSDDNGIWRVVRLKFRLRTEKEVFLYYRHGP
jgi:hypothetical protein